MRALAEAGVPLAHGRMRELSLHARPGLPGRPGVAKVAGGWPDVELGGHARAAPVQYPAPNGHTP